MTRIADVATVAVFYGLVLVVFCGFGALAERYLLRQRSNRRVRRNLRRAGLL